MQFTLNEARLLPYRSVLLSISCSRSVKQRFSREGQVLQGQKRAWSTRELSLTSSPKSVKNVVKGQSRKRNIWSKSKKKKLLDLTLRNIFALKNCPTLQSPEPKIRTAVITWKKATVLEIPLPSRALVQRPRQIGKQRQPKLSFKCQVVFFVFVFRILKRCLVVPGSVTYSREALFWVIRYLSHI